MPEYLSPGVYVEEIDAGPKPISPVATSTAGAVGVTPRGPATPTLITNYGEFVRTFGGPLAVPDASAQALWAGQGEYWQAAEAVKGFFDEGGARVYFQRVVASGATAAHADFKGGLHATLTQDVAAADTQIHLSHVFGIAIGATLTLVTDDGTQIAAVAVDSVDYATRTVTLTAAAGVSARRGLDLAAILPVNTLNILTATATSPGAWGNELSVRITPVVGARRTLAATPTSGPRVTTTTSGTTSANATSVKVNAISGSLPTTFPFWAQVDGGPALEVTGVDTTSGTKLLVSSVPTAIAAGTDVAVLRTAIDATKKVITVSGADRLYPGAVIQLEGVAGTAVHTVAGVAGARVTLVAAVTTPVLEGDVVSVLEAEVDVRLRQPTGNDVTEHFGGLRLTNTPDPTSLVAGVNLGSRLVRLTAGGVYDGTKLDHFPAATTGAMAPLATGDDALASLKPADYVGADLGPGQRTGIQALEEIDQVAICFAPGIWDADVRNALITHCETLGDRFAILDTPPGLSIQQVEAFRSPIDTKYAALYYPWLEITDPRPGGGVEQVAPSGFIAGIYARTDTLRGVHKAPANEVLRSIRGFAQRITEREQDILNPQNVNVLRAFPGRGNRVWGARVLTSDSAWKYVPVRRLFLMLEESIDEGTQWAVFEPNAEPLWARFRQTIDLFLETQWRTGALQGVTKEQAYFVVCDRSTMTQDDIDNGRLICHVGVAPVKPAEFVIVRIQQKALETASN